MMFLLVLGRLFFLAFFKSEELSAAAVNAQTRAITIAKTSGTIYDRNLKKITNTKTEKLVLIIPSNISNPRETALSIAINCGGNSDLYEKNIKNNKIFTVKLIDITADIPGGILFSAPAKSEKPIASHLIGYNDGDGKAVSGILKSFEYPLAKAGGKIVCRFQADAAKRQISGIAPTIENTVSESGIALTIDKGIQEITEKAMEKIPKGAAVVTEIGSGKILAMASTPAFSPEKIADYLESEDGELLNRALSSYDAGSIFKIVVLAAYLEKFDSPPQLIAECKGHVMLGGLKFSCHKADGHGVVGIEDAFAQSCNIYFYELAKIVGTDKIIDVAERFGIGERRYLAEGINSKAGALPARVKKPSLSYIANVAIGQGGVMFGVLDAAYIVSAVASGGNTNMLRVFEGYVEKGVLQRAELSPSKQIIGKKSADYIKDLMIYTVESGTGRAARPEIGGAGGKTASAETGSVINGQQIIHGWFCGFYPAENPKYSISIIAENGRTGSASASPVFKEIADGIDGLSKLTTYTY